MNRSTISSLTSFHVGFFGHPSTFFFVALCHSKAGQPSKIGKRSLRPSFVEDCNAKKLIKISNQSCILTFPSAPIKGAGGFTTLATLFTLLVASSIASCSLNKRLKFEFCSFSILKSSAWAVFSPRLHYPIQQKHLKTHEVSLKSLFVLFIVQVFLLIHLFFPFNLFNGCHCHHL